MLIVLFSDAIDLVYVAQIDEFPSSDPDPEQHLLLEEAQGSLDLRRERVVASLRPVVPRMRLAYQAPPPQPRPTLRLVVDNT